MSCTRYFTIAAAWLLTLLPLPVGAVEEPLGGNGWGFPKDVSLHGWRIDTVIEVTMIFVTILFIIMVIWMAWAVVKHGKNHQAEYDLGNAKKQTIFAVCLSSLIFLVVDGYLFVNSTWDTHVAFWNFDDAEAHPEAVRVEINARQWAWDIRYAGPDGAFKTRDDIVTMNDMRVPVHAPVIVQLAASDVIHAFYLPHLRVKTDAVPGMVNRLWFQAEETGTFEIACAEHCGMAHYKMRGLLTVLSKEDFETWAKEASGNSALAYSPKDTDAHWGWAWRELD